MYFTFRLNRNKTSACGILILHGNGNRKFVAYFFLSFFYKVGKWSFDYYFDHFTLECINLYLLQAYTWLSRLKYKFQYCKYSLWSKGSGASWICFSLRHIYLIVRVFVINLSLSIYNIRHFYICIGVVFNNSWFYKRVS